jgi:hypothetical protein
LLRLSIELADPSVEAILRALDGISPKREEQVYILRYALECLQAVAFPHKFCNPNGGEVRKSSLALLDTL